MQHLQPNTTLQGGKYRIERVLGQGGFGITYLAEQVSLKRMVAIKEFFMKNYCSRDKDIKTMTTPSVGVGQLVEKYRKKFIKEACNLAKLNHPNIISVIEVFEENGTVYYTMPYLSKGSLYDYVKKNGVLSEERAMKYIRQTAFALQYMHDKMLMCHFDVKPQNILLDDYDNAVLIDFGISKNYDSFGHESTATPVGISEGYAPIEQYQQHVEEFSPVSDVYALGATLYFLLHGKRPVNAPSRASGTPLLISSMVSQRIKGIIESSMKVSKVERAKSVNVFLGVFVSDIEEGNKGNDTDEQKEELRDLDKNQNMMMDREDEGTIVDNKKFELTSPSKDHDLQEIIRKANEGLAIAQVELGYYYQTEQKNFQKAFYWYREAAKQGHPLAYNNLGICYGVQKDYSKAFKCFQRAAIQNLPEALNNLGLCYQGGLGVQEDYQKALQCFLKAKSLGYKKAEINIKSLAKFERQNQISFDIVIITVIFIGLAIIFISILF